MRELELNKPEIISVPAINPWVSTGFLVKEDSVYKLEVIPPEQTWRDGKYLGEITADGKLFPHFFLLYPFLRMPSVKWFALLGCINHDSSTNFKIGTKLENFSPPEEGELICFVNDALGFNDFFYKHNNSGEITLAITKIR